MNLLLPPCFCILILMISSLKIMVSYYFILIFIALKAYLSTPKFVKTLTDISEELITVANRTEYLREELKKVNLKLPGSVYLPFVSGILSILYL